MRTLVLYYSRTELTKKIVDQIAAATDAEVIKLDDGVSYKGLMGWVKASYRSMKSAPVKIEEPQTKLPLSEYDQVVLAAPIWAETWSCIAKGFLYAYGKELPEKVHYVMTHMSGIDYAKVVPKMDQYLKAPHTSVLSVSTKKGGYEEELKQFIQGLQE